VKSVREELRIAFQVYVYGMKTGGVVFVQKGARHLRIVPQAGYA
jgi:hypothetical protein